MLNRKKITIQLLELAKKELVAVIAVGAVLAFLFSQSTATTINTPEISSNETVFIQSAGSYLYNNSPTIRFGQDIKGINSSKETWTDAKSAANFGTSIIATIPTQVTISQVASGTWTLYLTGTGNITVNGTQYNLGKNKTTASGTVLISNGTLIVKFGVNAQLWEITSTTAVQTNIFSTQTPTILSLIPASRELKIGTVLTPVPIVQSQTGAIMSKPLIEWSSSNIEVATVENNGAITALSPGVATIKATIAGTNLTTTMSINVPVAQPREMPPVFEINIEPESAKINDLLSKVVEEATEFVNIDEAVQELAPLSPAPTEAADKTPSVIPEKTKQPTLNLNRIFNEAQTKTLTNNNSSYIPEAAIQEILKQEDNKLTAFQRLTIKINFGFRQIVSDIKTILMGSSKTIIDQETNEEIIIEKPSAFKILRDFIAQLFTNKEINDQEE